MIKIYTPKLNDFVFHFYCSNKRIIFDFYQGHIDFFYRHNLTIIKNDFVTNHSISKTYD